MFLRRFLAGRVILSLGILTELLMTFEMHLCMLRVLGTDPDGAQEHYRTCEKALGRLGDASDKIMNTTREMLDRVDQIKRLERRGQDILQ